MTAALVWVMALRQEQEGPLRGLGVFLRWVAAQLLEALPVGLFFRLLLPLPAFSLSPVFRRGSQGAIMDASAWGAGNPRRRPSAYAASRLLIRR